MRPEQRASENQRDSVRAEGHAQWDRIMDAWETVSHQAKEMGRGYPSGGEGGGEVGSLTERVALSEAFDPATAASDWLAHLQETRGHLKNLDGSLKRILPVDPSSIERGRVNQVDACTWCHEPAPKVKRLDGQPYCHPDLERTCWRSAYDAKRRSA